MYADEDYPAGWLTQFRRGVFSGAGLLLLAVAAGTVPAFLVWLVPGADTTPATSAVKAGALLTLSAAHGGIRLNGDSVTLVPLLVTALLGWLVAGQARRSDSMSAVLGLAVGYGLGSGVLARWAELGSTRAPSLRSAIAGWLFVLVVGGAARGLDALWPRLTFRHQRLARAGLAAFACYVGAGAVLVAGSLVWHLGDATALQRQVAPGVAGLPIALLGLAATPNAVLAGVGYLAGPGFDLGSHTSVSATAVAHGPLPSFPLTAAVPEHPAPLAGVLVIALAALTAGWCAYRLVAAGSGLARWLDAAGAAVLAGGLIALSSALASGGIGDGALAHVGSSWWAVGGSAIGLVGLSAGGWSLVGRFKPALVGTGAHPMEPKSSSESKFETGRPRLRSIPGSAATPAQPASATKPATATKPASATKAEEKPAKDRHVS